MWSRHAKNVWARWWWWWEWVSLANFSFLQLSSLRNYLIDNLVVFFPCLTHLSRARANYRRQKKKEKKTSEEIFPSDSLNNIAQINNISCVCWRVRTKTMNDFLLSSTTTSTWFDLVCTIYFFSSLDFFWKEFFFLLIQGHRMYKVFTSFWSKPSSSSTTSNNNKLELASDTFIDEDGWVLVSDTGSFLFFALIDLNQIGFLSFSIKSNLSKW